MGGGASQTGPQSADLVELARRLGAGLSPVDAAWSVAAIGDQTADALPAAEVELIDGANGKRQKEFIAGRVLAHAGLTALGADTGPLLPAARGALAWPTGIVGSISHCDDVCACLVARSSGLTWVGVDLEEYEPLPARVVPRVMSAKERRAIGDLVDSRRAGRIVFSAKECFYKALAPALDRVLAFAEVEVSLVSCAPGAGTFDATFVEPSARPRGCPKRLGGSWSVAGSTLLTRIADSTDTVTSAG